VRLQNLLDNNGLLTNEGVFIAEIPDGRNKITEQKVLSEFAEIFQ
jgi:hypothetical protein